MTWALDLDGVVWRGDAPVPGSADAVAKIAAAGHDTLYVTNNSALTAQGYVDKLATCGIQAEADQIVHGGHAVARLVEPGERVLVCAGDGVMEALTQRSVMYFDSASVEGFEPPAVDAVVVGWLPDFDYRRLTLAVRSGLAGARLIAPSSDPLYPTADGVLMGGGGLVSAVAYSTKLTPQFAGKPEAPIADAVRERVAKRSGAGATVTIVVGDQPMTDGALAERLGVDFGLVLSGVTHADHPPLSVAVANEVKDLLELVELRLAAAGSAR